MRENKTWKLKSKDVFKEEINNTSQAKKKRRQERQKKIIGETFCNNVERKFLDFFCLFELTLLFLLLLYYEH